MADGKGRKEYADPTEDIVLKARRSRDFDTWLLLLTGPTGRIGIGVRQTHNYGHTTQYAWLDRDQLRRFRDGLSKALKAKRPKAKGGKRG